MVLRRVVHVCLGTSRSFFCWVVVVVGCLVCVLLGRGYQPRHQICRSTTVSRVPIFLKLSLPYLFVTKSGLHAVDQRPSAASRRPTVRTAHCPPRGVVEVSIVPRQSSQHIVPKQGMKGSYAHLTAANVQVVGEVGSVLSTMATGCGSPRGTRNVTTKLTIT